VRHAADNLIGKVRRVHVIHRPHNEDGVISVGPTLVDVVSMPEYRI